MKPAESQRLATAIAALQIWGDYFKFIVHTLMSQCQGRKGCVCGERGGKGGSYICIEGGKEVPGGGEMGRGGPISADI